MHLFSLLRRLAGRLTDLVLLWLVVGRVRDVLNRRKGAGSG